MARGLLLAFALVAVLALAQLADARPPTYSNPGSAAEASGTTLLVSLNNKKCLKGKFVECSVPCITGNLTTGESVPVHCNNGGRTLQNATYVGRFPAIDAYFYESLADIKVACPSGLLLQDHGYALQRFSAKNGQPQAGSATDDAIFASGPKAKGPDAVLNTFTWVTGRGEQTVIDNRQDCLGRKPFTVSIQLVCCL